MKATHPRMLDNPGIGMGCMKGKIETKQITSSAWSFMHSASRSRVITGKARASERWLRSFELKGLNLTQSTEVLIHLF